MHAILAYFQLPEEIRHLLRGKVIKVSVAWNRHLDWNRKVKIHCHKIAFDTENVILNTANEAVYFKQKLVWLHMKTETL